MPTGIIVLTAAFAVLLGAALPVSANADPLAGYAWNKRVLLVSAGSSADPQFEAQKTIFVGMGKDAVDRDLVLVEAMDDSTDARALRRKFGVSRTEFTVLLIGKDGGEKLRSSTPLSAEQILPVIDAMPMRQSEMRRPKP